MALAEALAALGQAVQLKWPNDLLIAEKKLGGILIETHSVRNSQTTSIKTIAVIGIGINLELFDDNSAEAKQLVLQRQPVAALTATTP